MHTHSWSILRGFVDGVSLLYVHVVEADDDREAALLLDIGDDAAERSVIVVDRDLNIPQRCGLCRNGRNDHETQQQD